MSLTWLRWVVLPVAVAVEGLLLAVAALLTMVVFWARVAERAALLCCRWGKCFPDWSWYLGEDR